MRPAGQSAMCRPTDEPATVGIDGLMNAITRLAVSVDAYTGTMAEEAFQDDTQGDPSAPRLPKHLAALVGALHGPSDLSVNHDKYLTYPHAEESGGVASA